MYVMNTHPTCPECGKFVLDDGRVHICYVRVMTPVDGEKMVPGKNHGLFDFEIKEMNRGFHWEPDDHRVVRDRVDSRRMPPLPQTPPEVEQFIRDFTATPGEWFVRRIAHYTASWFKNFNNT